MPLPTPPTLLLAAGGIALVWGHYRPVHSPVTWGWYSLAALLFTAGSLWADSVTPTHAPELPPHHRVWINDPLAISEQALVLVFGLLAGVALLDRRILPRNAANQHGFFLFTLAGLMLIARSNDFLSLGMSLEMTSLASLAYRRLNLRASELIPSGATSPVVKSAPSVPNFSASHSGLQGLSSLGLWLGIALLMNTLATTEFDAIKRILVIAYNPDTAEAALGSPSKLVLLAAGLIVMGLYGRMGIIALLDEIDPDSPASNRRLSGFLLLSGPLAGAIALTRLCGVVFEGLGDSLAILLIVLCLVAFVRSAVMTVRGFTPGVKSMSRWVRSLLVAQSAWLGISFISVAMELQHPDGRWGKFLSQPEGLALLVYTQFAQLLACGGVVWTVESLERSNRGIEYLEDLKGLARFAWLAAITLMISLISCAGGPGTAGFWGRWWTIVAGLNVHIKTMSSILEPHASIRALLLAGTLCAIPLAGVAIKCFREMFLEQPIARGGFVGRRGSAVAGMMAAAATLLLGVAPQLLLTPLRSIEAPHERLPQTQPRGSGKNHSVNRSSMRCWVEFAESSCQERCTRQASHHFLISIKVAVCSWQSPTSWAQFCPVWSGTLEPDHHPSEDNPFILVDPNS